MKLKTTLITSALILSFPLTVLAKNDIPSCYQANKIEYKKDINTEIFLLIDETTNLDANLQNSVKANTLNLVKPGNAFTVAKFSAFAQNRYLDVLSAGFLESPMPEDVKNNTPMELVKKLDSCLINQQKYAVAMAKKSIEKGLSNTSADLVKSDILGSLKDFSSVVKESKAKNKIVFISSDMLENSSITSFYSSNTIKKIDAKKELENIGKENMFTDFSGAKVYILGAGTINEESVGKNKAIYRDPKTMGSIKDFWNSYFSKSNAKVEEFGMPALLGDVK